MTATTVASPPGWRPDQAVFSPGDAVPSALFNVACTVVTDTLEGDAPSARLPFVRIDPESGIVAEAETITADQGTFDEVVVTTSKVSALGRYSFEVTQQPNAAQLILDSLSRSVINKADALFLGNETEPLGLVNSGIAEGGTVETDLDPVIDAAATIEDSGGTVTHLIMSPSAWAYVAKLKTADDSNQSLIGAGTADAERMLLSKPVLVSHNMPAGSMLVIDRGTVIGASSPVRVDRSEHAFFTEDVIAIRCLWRIGWSVQRPERIVRLSVGADNGGTER